METLQFRSKKINQQIGPSAEGEPVNYGIPWFSESMMTSLMQGDVGEAYRLIEDKSPHELRQFLKILDDVLPDAEDLNPTARSFWKDVEQRVKGNISEGN